MKNINSGWETDFSGMKPLERKAAKKKELFGKIDKVKDENKQLKAELYALKEKLKKYEPGEIILEVSPESKKLPPEDKRHLLSSGGKKFLEDKADKPEITQEISKFNADIKPVDNKEVILAIPSKNEDKKKDVFDGKLVDVQSSDYYTSLSDNEVDKIEIAFLNEIIKDKGIFEKLDYLANLKPISKIEFLKPIKKIDLTITSNLSIPSIPKVPNIPNIPTLTNLNKTIPGNIPPVPNLTIPFLQNKPKTVIELDKKLEDIEQLVITADDIYVGDDTLYLGKFLFAKLFQNYLLESGIKQIPASVKTALSQDNKPLLKLRESYFSSETFCFDRLDRYLLLGYNSKLFDGNLIQGKIEFPQFRETPTAFLTDNENNLKDYVNFYNIKFDYNKYIEYALLQIMTKIKEGLHKYHTLEEIQLRLEYKAISEYTEQKNILLTQFNALQQEINIRTSKMRIEQIFKKTPKLAKNLLKAVIEYKEPEKKVETKKEVAKEKKKERIMLLQALGINVKSRMESDSMYSMQYEMQAKKLLKAKSPQEVVEHLMTMAKGGLRSKGDKSQNIKDRDIARILLENLTKYEQMK